MASRFLPMSLMFALRWLAAAFLSFAASCLRLADGVTKALGVSHHSRRSQSCATYRTTSDIILVKVLIGVRLKLILASVVE